MPMPANGLGHLIAAAHQISEPDRSHLQVHDLHGRARGPIEPMRLNVRVRNELKVARERAAPDTRLGIDGEASRLAIRRSRDRERRGCLIAPGVQRERRFRRGYRPASWNTETERPADRL